MSLESKSCAIGKKNKPRRRGHMPSFPAIWHLHPPPQSHPRTPGTFPKGLQGGRPVMVAVSCGGAIVQGPGAVASISFQRTPGRGGPF